jgi:hypothetical protein
MFVLVIHQSFIQGSSFSLDQTDFSFNFTTNTIGCFLFYLSAGCVYHCLYSLLSFWFFSRKKRRIFDTTPSVGLTLTGRQLNTTPLRLASFTIVYTREPSSDKIAFISFCCSCLIFVFWHLNTTELMCFNEHELSNERAN